MIRIQPIPTVMRRALAALAFLLLAACETPPPGQSFPEITFDHKPGLTLDVAEIQVESKFTAPLTAPHVEHLMPAPPERSLRRWAVDRLRAAGRGGSARFTILDATVVEDRLPLTKGVRGVFTTEQAERYTATVEARLVVFDDRGNELGTTNAKATHSTTVAEDASLHERERTWFTLTETLMNTFDAEMEQVTRQFLGGFLR